MRQDFGDRSAQLDETHAVRLPFGGFRALLQDRDRSSDAGADEPGFVEALQHRDELESRQNPALQLEAVFHVEPLAGGQQTQPAVWLQERGRMRPEIAVQIAPAREVRTGLLPDEIAVVLFRAVLRVAISFGVVALDLLLADIGGIADDRVEQRNLDVTVLIRAESFGFDMDWHADERSSDPDVEEIGPGNPRVIFVLDQVTGGKVDRGEVAGKRRNVHAVKFVQHRRVGPFRRELAFACISTYQERAAATGWVQQRFGPGPDTEAVDEIDDFDP